VVTEGAILDTLAYENLQSPYAKFKPQTPLEEFLRDYSLAGGTHHLGLVFGHREQDFRRLARLLGTECVVV
jgi:L-arabinose isomerase